MAVEDRLGTDGLLEGNPNGRPHNRRPPFGMSHSFRSRIHPSTTPGRSGRDALEWKLEW